MFRMAYPILHHDEHLRQFDLLAEKISGQPADLLMELASIHAIMEHNAWDIDKLATLLEEAGFGGRKNKSTKRSRMESELDSDENPEKKRKVT